jgi:hypothetical protein
MEVGLVTGFAAAYRPFDLEIYLVGGRADCANVQVTAGRGAVREPVAGRRPVILASLLAARR